MVAQIHIGLRLTVDQHADVIPLAQWYLNIDIFPSCANCGQGARDCFPVIDSCGTSECLHCNDCQDTPPAVTQHLGATAPCG